MLKKFDDGTFLDNIADGNQEFTPIQIIGMMIATAHKHYEQEYKRELKKIHGMRDNPFILGRYVENELKMKYDPQKGDFVEEEGLKSSLLI